ncbi:MAG: hypothetical protein B9S32_13435 [Verrucomicrobia bacterium Tous-C9LFEB]|nr:MAG: hypothetical protein B9S32_13435 [Verrucomicrobia bacterium Tous-C9LFEB]
MNASCVAIVGFKCLPESPDEAPPLIGEEPPPPETKFPDAKELKPWGPVLMPWISPIPTAL